jgi:Xaa-Pro aminopeptidase
METVQPILKRGRDVWDQINMPKSEFLQRVDKIRESMRKEKIDVLLLYGAGVNDYGDQCYVSNLVTKLTAGALVVLPRNGEPTLFFEGSSRGLKIGQQTTWVDDVRSSLAGVFSSTGSLAGDCVKYLHENHFIPSRVGLAGVQELMPYREFHRLIEGTAGCEIVSAGPILTKLRMIKSVRESDQIRRASRIVSNALGATPGFILGNPNERTVEAKIDWAARVQGAEDVRVLLARPGQTDGGLRPADAAPISPGDTVMVYLAASFERYWAEGLRTFVAEKSRLTEIGNEKLSELYRNALVEMKHGKTVSQFHQEILDKLLSTAFKSVTDYGLGNGIGLSLEELPILDAKTDTPFAAGMCIALRLAIRDQTRGAVMVGNTIYLSGKGAEVLTV